MLSLSYSLKPIAFLFLSLLSIGTINPATLANPMEFAKPHRSDRLEDTTAADGWFQIGLGQFRRGEFHEARATYEKVLAIYRQLEDSQGIAKTLNELGRVSTRLGEYGRALEGLSQALALFQELGDRTGIVQTLNNLGIVRQRLGEYPQALALHQEALETAESTDDGPGIGESLHNIAAVRAALGSYFEALDLYQNALEIRREVGDKFDEGRTLNNLGGVYFSLGEYSQSLQLYQNALEIATEIGNRASEGLLLNNIGLIYLQTGEWSQAIEFFNRALAIAETTGDRRFANRVLNNLGIVSELQGDYETARESYNQSLNIAREIDDRTGIANALDNIGGLYYAQSQYVSALDFYQQALDLHREIGYRNQEANSLNNLGGVYFSLGQFDGALEFLQKALSLRQSIGDKAGESATLRSLGILHHRQQQYPQALAAFQQALSLAEEIGDRHSASQILNTMGSVYTALELYPQALEVQQQALTLIREMGNISGESTILNSIGITYGSQRDYTQALEYLQNALAIFETLDDRAGMGATLSNIAYLLEQQQQPELAIVFYKQSVNLTQTIRQELRQLSQQQQRSFADTVADRYRHLADLLLQQDRVLEAQQVLDLLKLQEIEDYLRPVRGNAQADTIPLQPAEQELLDRYQNSQNQTIALGRELEQLRNISPESRTPQQEARLAELVEIQQDLRADFNQFINDPAVVELTQQLSQTAGGQNLPLQNLNRVQRALKQLDEAAVLLYPLILEDRLELVLVTPYSPPLRRTVSVNRADFNRAIVEFRSALVNPVFSSEVRSQAQQFYDWLIKPLEADLQQAEATTIVYAPDGALRYLPLAALHDGNSWLVEHFRINNITAASLIDFAAQPLSELRVLAGAFTEGTYTVEVGDHSFTFSGLPFARREVEGVAETIAETTKLLDADFNRETTIPQLGDRNIVHFATHAAFVSGIPEESFILFGNGDRVTLQEIGLWDLSAVDLVVLSACQTALGDRMGNGEEILGFGYQVQLAGARNAIASLWVVDDRGTQVLMDAFYQVLRSGSDGSGTPITIAEALRQAQLSLIRGDEVGSGDSRGIAIVEGNSGDRSPTASPFSHPYFWAPFVLIGN